MDREEITTRLHNIATSQLGWERLPLGTLEEQLDSMQRLALVIAVEDAFEVIFDPEDEQTVRSVDDLVNIIAAKVADE